MAIDLKQFLARVPLFQGLNNRSLNQLAKRFITRTYQPDEAIVNQGKGGAGLFTIVSGHAEAVVETADGSRTVVNSFNPTDFFGEITLLDDGPRTASVIATEETECLVLNRSEFIAVMKNDADMGVVIGQELAKRLRRTIEAMG
jgi:CRP-like cAMP-binding protein